MDRIKFLREWFDKEIMWKINYVNGVRHGHTWWGDVINEYYINDVKSTKSEFEEYKRKNK